MPEQSPFEALQIQLKMITDRVRAVAAGKSNGLYLHGRPGTSKTFTVRSKLTKLAVPYVYQAGRVTPVGLFDLIEEHPDRVIVLDDVATIFQSPMALQFLLAALGNNQSGAREVRYKTAREDRIVRFTGAIIAISNLALAGHDAQLLAALNDRINVVQYEPTDEQLISLMRHIAAKGVDGVSPADCQHVLEFLLQECEKREIRPSLRLFVDKALKDFQLHHQRECELDWRDLVVSNLEQQLINPVHPAKDLRKADQVAAQRRIVQEICTTYPSRKEQIREWKKRTGNSPATFYRRLKELELVNHRSSAAA